jgi:predicted PhzF superfamily epimerase YddE/YHI9
VPKGEAVVQECGAGLVPIRRDAGTGQGTALGRAGRVSVERIGDDVWVGGHCVSVLAGSATG